MTAQVGLIAVKVIQVVLLIIAIILISVAAGACNYLQIAHGRYTCYESSRELSLPYWNYQYFRFSEVQVQYFVFISSILLAVGSIISLVGVLVSWYTSKLLSLVVAVFGIVLCIVNGALEAWLTIGFGTGMFGMYGGYVASWAAAAAFYFLAALCYIVDTVLTTIWYAGSAKVTTL